MIAPRKQHDTSRPQDWAEIGKDYKPTRTARRFVWVFGFFLVAIAGSAFVFKVVEFILTFTAGQEIRFAIMPVVTYLIVAAGFACLFLWGYFSGQFRNLEAAKFRMLEMQDQIDAAEARASHAGKGQH